MSLHSKRRKKEAQRQQAARLEHLRFVQSVWDEVDGALTRSTEPDSVLFALYEQLGDRPKASDYGIHDDGRKIPNQTRLPNNN